jgi:tight adherence protein C
MDAVRAGMGALVAVTTAAAAVALWAAAAERQRRRMVRRIATGASAEGAALAAPRQGAARAQGGVATRLGDWLAARVPAELGEDRVLASRLVRAGLESEEAPLLLAVARVGLAAGLPLLALWLGPAHPPLLRALWVALAAAVALLAPFALLDRLTAVRQRALRRALPDTLDLLVVCVEAGVSMDAALQRVAREMGPVHPRLASELAVMNRRLAAGLTRDEALTGLYLRTGVDELRTLAAHLVQAERWGTSIATVLRVTAKDLRRRRRLAAEKRAATAGTRMLIPLALCIFPTIFVVLLGPALLQVGKAFGVGP